MKIIPAIAARHAEHSRWRHTLHAQPELAYAEHLTADFVAAKLDACNIPYVRGLGRTGIVAQGIQIDVRCLAAGHNSGRCLLRYDALTCLCFCQRGFDIQHALHGVVCRKYAFHANA